MNCTTMKKIYLFIFCLLGLFSQAQFNGFNMKYEVLDPNTAGKIFRNPISTANRPEGQPYLVPAFQWAKIERVNQKARMRYNVYADEFEFITPKNDTLILDKLSDFSPIFLGEPEVKYVLTTYTHRSGKNHTGYLIERHTEGNFTLYSKENISFYDGKTAKTTLETSRPAKYVKAAETFYLKKEKVGVFEFPSTKKQLIQLFPSQKEQIEDYFKQHPLDLKQPNDRLELMVFLNGL